MLDRQYLDNYSNIMLYIANNCSEETILLVAEFIKTDEILLQIEQIIKSEPSEQELLEKLEPFKREWLKKFEAKGRLGFINNLLLYFMNPFRMRKIYKANNRAYYVMTFTKNNTATLIEKAEFLIFILKQYLNDSEKLVVSDKAISVVGENYRYSYQLEAYKRANHTVYFDEQGMQTELIYRMGIETAVSHLRRFCYNRARKMNKYGWKYFEKMKESVYSRVSKRICRDDCNDPAAEFVNTIKEIIEFEKGIIQY